MVTSLGKKPCVSAIAIPLLSNGHRHPLAGSPESRSGNNTEGNNDESIITGMRYHSPSSSHRNDENYPQGLQERRQNCRPTCHRTQPIQHRPAADGLERTNTAHRQHRSSGVHISEGPDCVGNALSYRPVVRTYRGGTVAFSASCQLESDDSRHQTTNQLAFAKQLICPC